MKAINNFENVQAVSGEFSKPTAGGYIISILTVEDVPLNSQTGKGDYLKIYYDIADGEFENYYTDISIRFGGGYYTSFIRSYKEKAIGMFKHFINCLEESNAGYKWNWDEKSLEGRYVGAVLGEEQYRKKDGSLGVRLYVKDIKTVQQIKNGDYEIPEMKKIKLDTITYDPYPTPNFEDIDSMDDLPF